MIYLGRFAAVVAVESDYDSGPEATHAHEYPAQKHTQTHAPDNTTTTKIAYTVAGQAAGTSTPAGTRVYRA